jgi:hypothetical protein
MMTRTSATQMQMLLGLCAFAAVSLLALPLEQLVPAGSRLQPWQAVQVRLLAVVQPTLLMALGLWLGWRFAQGLGLGAPMLAARADGRPLLPLLRARLPAIAGAAVLAATLMIVWNRAIVPLLFARSLLTEFSVPLFTRLAYGGIGEEVIMRWGMLSALAAGAVRLGLERDRALLISAVLAALLFGAGHLPLLAAMAPAAPGWAAPAVVLANAGPGFMFGGLFIRYGLEAAMLAHAGAHLLAWIIG